MAWNGTFRPFVPRAGEEQPFSFLYNPHYPPGVDQVKCRDAAVVERSQPVEVPATEKNNQDRKRRLTSDQLESLEKSFQEEVKLEPERKMVLAQELGLQPRQVAVWFQNRRARWKAKQLERLYLTLKQEFDAICKQKQQLQEEVIKLKIKLEEERSAAAVAAKQFSTAHTEISGEETVESTSVVAHSSNNMSQGTSNHQIAECNYLFNLDECNPASLPYWGVLPAAYL